MDIVPSDILCMKKKHPCGANRWLVLRAGTDLLLRCMQCGREVTLPRLQAEKSIRSVERPKNLSTGSHGSR